MNQRSGLYNDLLPLLKGGEGYI